MHERDVRPHRSRAQQLVWAAALLLVTFGMMAPAARQGRGNQEPPPPPTLGLEKGTLEFDTPDFTLRLVGASQTIAALEPKGVPT